VDHPSHHPSNRKCRADQPQCGRQYSLRAGRSSSSSSSSTNFIATQVLNKTSGPLLLLPARRLYCRRTPRESIRAPHRIRVWLHETQTSGVVITASDPQVHDSHHRYSLLPSRPRARRGGPHDVISRQ